MGDLARQYNRYSKVQQAKGLAALVAADSSNKAAEQLPFDVSGRTLRYWHSKKEDGWLEEDDELRKIYERELSGLDAAWEAVLHKAMNHLLASPKKWENASLGTINAVAGTAQDKIQAIRGTNRNGDQVNVQVRVVNVQGNQL